MADSAELTTAKEGNLEKERVYEGMLEGGEDVVKLKRKILVAAQETRILSTGRDAIRKKNKTLENRRRKNTIRKGGETQQKYAAKGKKNVGREHRDREPVRKHARISC